MKIRSLRKALGAAILLSVLALPNLARAGFVEIGASGNYRKFFVDQLNYSESLSYTGSLSYYFWNSSALEASYTNGRAKSISPTQQNQTDFEMYGLDLVLSFAPRESAFKPYIKLGGAYQKKRIIFLLQNTDPIERRVEGTSPSAGFGFRLSLTESFGIRAGIDAWTSPLNVEPVTYDVAGRAGITWMF